MGLLRLYLAVVVAMAHLQSTIFLTKKMAFWGGYYLGLNAGIAVMAFYMISGFLISTVLDSKYKDHGSSQFYFNRFVRIFSLYLPILALAFILVRTTLYEFNSANILQKFTNIGLMGADWLIFACGPSNSAAWLALPNPLHQAWTLSAELTFYLAAPWLLRSNKAGAMVLFGSAITRIVLLLVAQDTDRWTYFFLPSTFLFFLLGHWARVAARQYQWLQKPLVAYALLGSCFAIFIAFRINWSSIIFFLPMTLLAASLPGLFQHTKDNVILNWLGALSYPIYLVHNLVRMQFETFGLLDKLPHFFQNAPVMMASYLAAVFIAAVAAHYLLEMPCAFAFKASRRVFSRRRPIG
jgi:peptidoglycan/LPS O-acetylase OafA/YrhL